MTVIHVVLFKYKPSVAAASIAEVIPAFLALKGSCVDPEDGKPYILELTGGTNDSPEGQEKGFTHAFVVKFADDAARQFYVFRDPSHEKFKGFVGPLIEDVLVFDYTV